MAEEVLIAGEGELTSITGWSTPLTASCSWPEASFAPARGLRFQSEPYRAHLNPPGAADVLHCQLDVLSNAVGEIWYEARARYRRFDKTCVDCVYPDGLQVQLQITYRGLGRYPP